jgi:hypothetical protein
MNWKKRKIVIVITVIATIGTLYATVGPRHHSHADFVCHSHQMDNCHGKIDKTESQNSDETIDVK